MMGKLSRIFKCFKVNLTECVLAVKGAAAPILAIALYEITPWAHLFTTLGYFIAIISMISMAMQPRAKFVQSMVINMIFVCAGSGIAVLVVMSSVSVRDPSSTKRTKIGSSGSPEAIIYDGSANAVAAVWLSVLILLVNWIRAVRPQMATAAIQFAILSITSTLYAPSFATRVVGFAFVRRLLITFFTAYALTIGAHILILPTTSRSAAMKDAGKLIDQFDDCLAKYRAYVRDIKAKKCSNSEKTSDSCEQAKEFKMSVDDAFGSFRTLKEDLDCARNEIALGKLTADNFGELYRNLGEVLQSLLGLATFLSMVERVRNGYSNQLSSSETLDMLSDLTTTDWEEVVSMPDEFSDEFRTAIARGLQHIKIQLGICARPRYKPSDVETQADDMPRPGSAEFAHALERRIGLQIEARQQLVQALEGSVDRLNSTHTVAGEIRSKQSKIYLALYLNCLVLSIAQKVLRQVQAADKIVHEGVMAKRRLIFPGMRQFASLMLESMMATDQDDPMAGNSNSGSNISVGDGLKRKRDPEHLPPVGVYETCTDYLRYIPHAFLSPGALFGLRAAVATMTVAVFGFLNFSRNFFLEQRGVWAVSAVAIAMTPQAGQSVFNYAMRILGTVLAAVMSILISYIGDGQRAAITVLFAIQLIGWQLLIVKSPKYALTGIISALTTIVITGYQLQVDVIGIAQATANGQKYHPIYLLAAYRVVAVGAGLLSALFWTFFPFPITTRGSLREKVGNTIYVLANYYSCVHTTLDIRSRSGSGISEDVSENHPLNKLHEKREEIFGKCLFLLGSLEEFHDATRYELRVGGRFPSKQYKHLIACLYDIFAHISLISLTSATFTEMSEGSQDHELKIKRDMQGTLEVKDDPQGNASHAATTSHTLTSTLCLLSLSISNAQPLPPYLSVHSEHQLAGLDSMNAHAQKGSYHAACAVVRMANSFLDIEVERLLTSIKDMVGEVDFGFHLQGTEDDARSLANTLLGSGGSDGFRSDSDGNMTKVKST